MNKAQQILLESDIRASVGLRWHVIPLLEQNTTTHPFSESSFANENNEE